MWRMLRRSMSFLMTHLRMTIFVERPRLQERAAHAPAHVNSGPKAGFEEGGPSMVFIIFFGGARSRRSIGFTVRA